MSEDIAGVPEQPRESLNFDCATEPMPVPAVESTSRREELKRITPTEIAVQSCSDD